MSPPKTIKVERGELERIFKVKWNLKKLVKKYIRANKKIMAELLQHIEAHTPSNLIQGYMFMTSADDKVCIRCARLHGMVFSSLDDAHRPPLHPHCRCYTQPKILDIITMKVKELGGEITVDDARAFDLEYGALTTEDGETIAWSEALGFIDKAVKSATNNVHEQLDEVIDKFFR